jgi:hypothetical protein
MDSISAVYAQREWQADRCLSRQELSKLALACGLHPINSPVEPADTDLLVDDTLPSAEEPDHVPVASSQSLNLAQAIVQRVQKGQFPQIQPAELEDPRIAEFAAHVLLLLRPQDQVQLQSFLKQKYSQYRLTCSESLKSAEAQCCLAFSMESYYLYIYEFLLIETLRTRSFRHCFRDTEFVSLVPTSFLVNPASQSEAVEQLRHLVDVVSALSDPNGPFACCTRFDSEMWNNWAKTESMARYVQKSEHEVFCIFLLDDFLPLCLMCFRQWSRRTFVRKFCRTKGAMTQWRFAKGKHCSA